MDYVEARGGKVLMKRPLRKVNLNEDGSVKSLSIAGTNSTSEEEVIADAYVSAMPVDLVKRIFPDQLMQTPFFNKLENLVGVPVINLHLWFDRKLTNIDQLLFSRSDLLSVYADMSNTCKEYYNEDKSMLELVLAPAADYIGKSDEDIVEATMKELERLFPSHIGPNATKPAKVLKYKVSGVQRSICFCCTATSRNEIFDPDVTHRLWPFPFQGCKNASFCVQDHQGAR